MKINIYDGLNYIRVKIDRDPMGRVPRSIITSMSQRRPDTMDIWAFEGKGSLSARREIYPEYKTRPSNVNSSGIFALQSLIREAMAHTLAIQVAVPGFEADDVIGALVAQYHKDNDITILSTDRDLNQLLVYHSVRSIANPIKNVPPEYVRLYKTFVGDPSDSIPGLKGFGAETWNKVDKYKLQVALKSGIQGLYVDAGLTPQLAAKAVENHSLLQKFWEVVGFLPLTIQSEHITVGDGNIYEADRILKQFNH